MLTIDNRYWRSALQLESTELVRRIYCKMHNRSLNTARAKQVVAAHLQGKEYYCNAAQSDISVQPLLLFYGVSSLSRALTLLLKQGGGEETLTQGHGLSCSGWSAVLTPNVGNSLRKLGSIKVQSCSGMFTDLMNATGNRSYLHVRSSSVDWSIASDIRTKIELNFCDLVQRIPDVRIEYVLWKQEPPLVVSVNEVRKTQDGFAIRTEKCSNLDSIIRYAEGRIAVTEESNLPLLRASREDLPLFINSFVEKRVDRIPDLYIASPLPNDTYLAQIPLTFILSYFLGMLCRYFPSHWMALSRGNIGDEVWPLIQACMSYIQKAFPQLMIEFIQQRMEEGPAA